MRDLAWRSLEEIVAFAAKMYILSYRKLSLFQLLSINFHEFNFRSSLALRKYFNNEIFPNYGIARQCMPSKMESTDAVKNDHVTV